MGASVMMVRKDVMTGAQGTPESLQLLLAASEGDTGLHSEDWVLIKVAGVSAPVADHNIGRYLK